MKKLITILSLAAGIVSSQTYNVAITNSLLGPVDLTFTGTQVTASQAIITGAVVNASITNSFAPVNNITNEVNVGGATINNVVTNVIQTTITNDIDVAGVVVTNIIQFVTETNNFTITGAVTSVNSATGAVTLTVQNTTNSAGVASYSGTVLSIGTNVPASSGNAWLEMAYDPRVIPSETNAWDDEFNGTNITLNASPATSGWFYVNTSSSNTYSVSNGFLITFAAATSGDNYNRLLKTIPSPPWTFQLAYHGYGNADDSYPINPALGVFASTNGANHQIGFFNDAGGGGVGPRITYMNSPTSFNSHPANMTDNSVSSIGLVYFRIRAETSNTNVIFGWSSDGFQYRERSINLPYTPTLVGFQWTFVNTSTDDLIDKVSRARIYYFRRSR